MARQWIDKLQIKIIALHGKTKGANLDKKYSPAFSNSYMEDFTVLEALEDIKQIEKISMKYPLEVRLYNQTNNGNTNRLSLKLFQYERPIALSDILPILENMGLRTFRQRPYRLNVSGISIWISDFSLSYNEAASLEITNIQDNFRECLIKINEGLCENDGFNKLVLGSNLPWRQVVILRAYAKYLHQIGFRFTQHYIEKTFANYHDIAKDLISLFLVKFDPKNKSVTKIINQLEKRINNNLEAVVTLDEDRILRTSFKLIQATLRTNYFIKDKNGNYKDYLSLKLASDKIPDLPKPHPLYETFVYSPRFEAIHLRSAKVARGGIRWSDRREDFRTEILGLMKAQKVKNAIIVPSGAKGGFVLKTVLPGITREELQEEVISCYKSFMCGLLDITDNLKNNKIITPKDVVCYDVNDPYLVVAADKGTATFSDIANDIAEMYGFWLGDAFASGGSYGYDHKKMGITARGAWESIRRHFHQININVFKDDFTVVGIGDMSGDVFGNGMIYCDHIKLVAAFDHRHIFLDPNPDPKKSYQERIRLFNLDRSSWDDYNKALISKGGGVYARTLKSITLTAEVKKALGIEESALSPNDLIQAILKAPVDLLFNGGIGTYVKGTYESHADVGDKTNEFCRVNGIDLRTRVVGEGGNLGFTQLGRIEYAINNGLINTDFIDNSAGVDCSDHEVNLKILLNKEMLEGKLSFKKRNQLLFALTKEVGALVLNDNYNQALAMGISVDHAPKLMGLYQTYLKELETTGVVDRVVEFLPEEKKLLERKAAGLGLTSPELAVLLAYTKIHVKNEILKSNALEKDPALQLFLGMAFPTKICKLYSKQLKEHPLKREIIATQLSNNLVNVMGITFVYRVQIETGAAISDIVRAQYVASRIFEVAELRHLVDSPEGSITATMQYELLHYVRGLTNLATRWFLYGDRLCGDLDKIIKHYSVRVKELERVIPDLMLGATKEFLESVTERFINSGVSKDVLRRFAVIRAMYTSLNITEVATQYKFDLIKTAKIYFEVGGRFNLVWFRDQIVMDTREGHWNTLARLTLRDELDILQKSLTIAIMKNSPKERNTTIMIENWIQKNQRAMARWEKLLELLYATTPIEYSMFFIAIRELSNWVSV